MNSPPLLEVRDLVKAFPGVRALDGVSMDLRAGEVHALVGENGAGKSTLISILAGVLAPDSGQVLVDGSPVTFSSPRASAGLGIAVVFQERSLSDNLSVAENIYANRQPLRNRALGLVDFDAMRRDAAGLLQSFGSTVDAGASVEKLSAADQQVVEILKAISTRPRVLILDEPTSSISSAEVERLFALLAEMKARGVACLYISHHLREVFEVADRVTVLRDGRRVHTCGIGEIDERELVARMVGRDLADLYGSRSGAVGDECFRIEGASRAGRFEDVGLRVHRGEIVGMAGLTGSGRADLARAIMGVEPLDRGTISIDGRTVSVRSPRDAVAAGIGYLTEDRKGEGLFLGQSVRDNCAAAGLRRFERSVGLMDDRAVDDFAETSVAQFGIATPSICQVVDRLSGGNQQKVLLAMWIGALPRFLIVDEPTRGVDVGARSDIYQRLRELAASGMGILLITSDLMEALGMSDRILVMRAGRIAGEFAGADATEEALIACAAGVGATRTEA